MPFVPTANAVECVVRATYLGEDHLTTLAFYNSLVDWTPGQLEELAQAVYTAWKVNFLAQFSNQYTLLEVVATYQGAETGPQASYTDGTFPTGSQTSAPKPSNVCKTIVFRTPLLGRNWRGANRLGGLAALTLVDNEVTETWMSDMLANYLALAAYVEGEIPLTQHIVISRVVDGAPRTVGAVAAVTEYVFPNSYSGTMRPRTPGHGS